MTGGAFDAYDLDKIQRLHDVELDSAPFGVIVVDPTGRILEYDTSVEPFEFVFALPRGPQRVSVVFVRLANDRDRATICVIRNEVAGSSPPP